MLNIVLFGPPGAGKGTQSEKLLSVFGLVHLSTGNLLRAEMANQTELGLQAKSLIEAGKLVPDEVVIGMIAKQISSHPDAKGFIFDGFPRTVAQAQALDTMLAEYHTGISCMLSIAVGEDELISRLLKRAELEGRADDTPATIQARLKEYNDKTLPVADYYAGQNKLLAINGVGAVEDIFKRIQDALAPLTA